MFALDCPRHGHRVLLDLGRMIRLDNLGDGLILITARCYDGELITAVTGAAATLPSEMVAHRPSPGESGAAYPLGGSRADFWTDVGRAT